MDVSGLPADWEWGKSDKGDGVPFFAPVWTGSTMAAVFCVGRGDEVSLGAVAGGICCCAGMTVGDDRNRYS